MVPPVVEMLRPDEHGLVRDLLVELHLAEQPYYPDHPQLTRAQLATGLAQPPPAAFTGENIVFAVRDDSDPEKLAAFCWCLLFDPGSGLEGEVAEVYVASPYRGRGYGEAMLRQAVELFRERDVTLAYVWTREENRAAVALYEGVGFRPSRQLIMTWYPME